MEGWAPYLAVMQCPKCERERLLAFTPRLDTQHYGCIRCPEHGFIWISKPKEDKKPRRKINSGLALMLPEKQRGFCSICCRTKSQLADLRPAVVLQVHHVWPVEKGGTDERANLQVLCSECHAEVHRRREAFARYHDESSYKDNCLGATALEAHRRSGESAIPLDQAMSDLGLDVQ